MWDQPTADELEELREEGYTREQIADHYDVSLAQVKRWIKEFGLAKKVNRKSKPPSPTTSVLDDGLSLLERAKSVLGKRVSEDWRGYKLDGKPTSADGLIEAARLQTKA